MNPDCSVPDRDRNLLSKDQQYLLDISNAITLGHCPEDLEKSDPGPLFHSRWLLRPTEDSKYFTDGPKHVFQAIQTSRYLSDEIRQVVDPVIQRNAFFENTENVLLAVLVNKREHIRELGYKWILKARQIVPKKKTVRNFVPPKINFQVSNYIEIVNWNSCVVYPPPMLRDLSEDDIKSLINPDTTPIKEIQKFPCHTQAVERCIKLVREASNQVCGREARDGYIRATLQSRSVMSNFSKKSDFKCVVDIKKKKTR
ncbi:hypothetical protein AVEN_109801-1 [Araneus ventricosus]|uniref:Uncharacterized protein n=1 Tax=Araneus ventricosus TaxID=182803 RepID=A0A4Y2KFS7_ARAVE|nr:hypothetical protein AVEN_109801-1 [Araneus ventricosus]